MPLRKADGPLTVQVPSPADDRPSWIGVGAVAVLGFVVGVVWPKLAGVRLGPSAPEAPTAAAAAPPASGGVLPSASRSAPPAAWSATATPPTTPLRSPPADGAVAVGRGTILACKTSSGDVIKGRDCGALPGLDALVLPRLRRMADCPETRNSNGNLHLVVRADFGRNALTVDLGRDRSLSTAEPLLVCAKTALASASLEGIAHEQGRYSVAYVVAFGEQPAPAAQPASGANAAEPNGTAQVEWDVAIVRDTPRTGKVIARLPRGTELRIGSSKDGWYPVKFGDGFGGDGWVYRGAIGR